MFSFWQALDASIDYGESARSAAYEKTVTPCVPESPRTNCGLAFLTGMFTRWYRSLYWRIALGVVGFLAAMLVVQAMLFVWAVSQSGAVCPANRRVDSG